jgi:hypothetical protein
MRPATRHFAWERVLLPIGLHSCLAGSTMAGLEKDGKVPRPAVAFGGAWEVQVLIPQHPRIRAAVDLCFHLISSRLVSGTSFKAQQRVCKPWFPIV